MNAFTLERPSERLSEAAADFIRREARFGACNYQARSTWC